MELEEIKNIYIGDGNAKIGRINNISLPSFITCPGMNKWCQNNCYSNRYENRFKRCKEAYIRNLDISKTDIFTQLIINKLKNTIKKDFRIHVSGDFYSVEYIDKWIHICKQLPNKNFWCYTRSWLIPKFFKKIKELNKLKNIQIFLSTDPTIDDIPIKKDFRIAFLEDDSRANGTICLHDSGNKHSCDECGFCFKNNSGNVIFKNKSNRRINK